MAMQAKIFLSGGDRSKVIRKIDVEIDIDFRIDYLDNTSKYLQKKEEIKEDFLQVLKKYFSDANEY